MMNELKSIEEEWRTFYCYISQSVSIPTKQMNEMKKCFFAGAFTYHTATLLIGLPQVSEEEAEKWISDRAKEFDAYYEEIKNDS